MALVAEKTSTVSVIKLHPVIGAEIRGVDLSRPFDDDTARAIKNAWYDHTVLVFRDQKLSEDDQRRFASLFGPVAKRVPPRPGAVGADTLIEWDDMLLVDRTWLPVAHSWRLNERHYGALQGLNKAETAKQFGDAQVLLWRRSYDVPPPPLAPDDPRSERSDRRYARLTPAQVPATECLKDTVARVLPLWNEAIAPAIRAGKRIVISAHGNSLRALVKHLDGISDDDIVALNIPNGIPLVYELDAELRPIGSRYLGDTAAAARAAAAVAAQGIA